LNNICRKIRLLRLKRELSIEKLALLAGISTDHLGKIERGLKVPKLDTLEKIASALNTSILHLIHINVDNIDNLSIDLPEKFALLFSLLNETELEQVYQVNKEVVKIIESSK